MALIKGLLSLAQLQAFKKINTEDFDKKYQDLISTLGYSINNFADDVLNAFTNEISIADNLNITQKTLTVTVNKNGGVIGGSQLKTSLSHLCQGTLVIRAINMTNASHVPSGTPFITYTDNSGLLTISNISNLTANEQYQLTVILF